MAMVYKVYTIYVQIFEVHNFRGLPFSKHFADQEIKLETSIVIVGILIFRELNFHGLLGICENRKNYTPQKFGRIRYTHKVAVITQHHSHVTIPT